MSGPARLAGPTLRGRPACSESATSRRRPPRSSSSTRGHPWQKGYSIKSDLVQNAGLVIVACFIRRVNIVGDKQTRRKTLTNKDVAAVEDNEERIKVERVSIGQELQENGGIATRDAR